MDWLGLVPPTGTPRKRALRQSIPCERNRADAATFAICAGLTAGLETLSMTQSFRDALAQAPMVADGAMGTMLYERGILYTTNYDELCLSRPAVVRRTHVEYLRAGAQLIETNTFGANRFRLQRHGFENAVGDINLAGARIARAAIDEAGTLAYVAGSVGPTGVNLKGLPEKDRADIRAAFEEQIRGLLDGGVDVLAIETMRQPDEMHLAIQAARTLSNIPVIAMVSFDTFGTMADGTIAERDGGTAQGMGASGCDRRELR